MLGLLVAATLALGIVLRLREEILEVPISAMLIFSVDSNAAASSRITETLVGAAAGLVAGLVLAPMRVQPAKEAVGDLSRQMADLLGRMAAGLADAPDPKRAAEWLDRTRALRGEIERVDDALAQAEESVRLNPEEAQDRRPGGRAAGRRRHAGAGRDGHAGAGSFGGRQRAAQQRAQPGQAGRDTGPAGGSARGAFRRGAGLRPGLLEADPVSTYPGDSFAAQAALGMAASLDAQGKTDLAADAYQRLINGLADATCVNAAKFALARIDEAQGKLNEAFTDYAYVAQHSNPNGSLGTGSSIGEETRDQLDLELLTIPRGQGVSARESLDRRSLRRPENIQPPAIASSMQCCRQEGFEIDDAGDRREVESHQLRV